MPKRPKDPNRKPDDPLNLSYIEDPTFRAARRSAMKAVVAAKEAKSDARLSDEEKRRLSALAKDQMHAFVNESNRLSEEAAKRQHGLSEKIAELSLMTRIVLLTRTDLPEERRAELEMYLRKGADIDRKLHQLRGSEGDHRGKESFRKDRIEPLDRKKSATGRERLLGELVASYRLNRPIPEG